MIRGSQIKNLSILAVLTLLLLVPLLANIPNFHFKSRVSGRVFYPKAKNRILKKMENYNPMHGKNSFGDPTQGIVIFQPLNFRPTIAPTPNAVLTQKGMTFYPKVLPITRGTTVYILNEDKEYHNVYSRTPGATFNIGRRPPGHLYPQKIKISGLIRVFCDIHEHMKAYILSLETPYFARVGKDGTYSVENLPNGKYKLVVYHPDFPAYEDELTISSNQQITRDIHWK